MIQEKPFRQDRLLAFCGGVLTKAKALAFGRVLIQAEALRVAGIVENVAGAETVPSTWNGGWQ